MAVLKQCAECEGKNRFVLDASSPVCETCLNNNTLTGKAGDEEKAPADPETKNNA